MILNGIGTTLQERIMTLSEINQGFTSFKGTTKVGLMMTWWTMKMEIFHLFMYADLDFKHPEVIQNLYDWADWFIETTGIHGFRLDAIKHIDSFFMGNFIRDIMAKYGEDFYVFGEFWNGDETANNDYLGSIDYRFDLVDVKLHHNLFDASRAGADYDLRIFLNKRLSKTTLNRLLLLSIITTHNVDKR